MVPAPSTPVPSLPSKQSLSTGSADLSKGLAWPPQHTLSRPGYTDVASSSPEIQISSSSTRFQQLWHTAFTKQTTCSRGNVPHHHLKRNVSSLSQPDYCSLSACLITGGGGGRAQGLNKWIQLWRIVPADTGIITFRIILPNASQQ